jgi:hypothetical protein
MNPGTPASFGCGSATGRPGSTDDRYPSMWRHPLYQGQASDMVNLSRAKDAALSWLRISGRMR